MGNFCRNQGLRFVKYLKKTVKNPIEELLHKGGFWRVVYVTESTYVKLM